MHKVRISSIHPERTNHKDSEGTFKDVNIEYNHFGAMTVATEIVSFIEEGITPLDIWEYLIKIYPLEGPTPTMDFYTKVRDIVSKTPLDV